MYKYYQTLKGIDPPVAMIELWKNTNQYNLINQHATMRGHYETKIHIQNEIKH